MVPVRKPFWMPKLPMFCRWIRELVPVMKALLCGVVWCAQLTLPVSDRVEVRNGRTGRLEITLPPTALEVALLACERRVLTLVPGVVPAAAHRGAGRARP